MIEDCSPAEIWWNSVAGPSEVVNEVNLVLLSTHNVILRVPRDLPWRHEMRDAIRELVQRSSGISDLSVCVIDVKDDLEDRLTPEEVLMKRCGHNDDWKLYRPGAGSVCNYMLRKQVLLNKIVWIKGIPTFDEYKRWKSFCSKWKSPSIKDGLIVIESSWPDIHPEGTFRVVDYEAHVNYYSVQLFNGLILDDEYFERSSYLQKRYVAAIASHLCGMDVEVAEYLVRNYDLITEDPIKSIQGVSTSDIFIKRGNGDTEDHVLLLCRENKTAELGKRIWEAQLETLFPIIEQERLEIIASLRGELEELIGANAIQQYNADVSNVEDIELGTMVYLMADIHDRGGSVLEIDSPDIRNRIRNLRILRNNLAHHSVCSTEQVRWLLKDYDGAEAKRVSGESC